MLIAVGVWTAASVSHAWVGGLVGFATARAVLGFGEGATFPGGLRTAADSLPADRRSRGMAIAYSGSTLGAIVTPLLVTPVALAYGWRPAFLITGALGAMWLAAWGTLARPPWLIDSRRTPRIALPNLRERRFWTLAVGMGLGGAPLGTVLTMSPVYLNRALSMTQACTWRRGPIPVIRPGWWPASAPAPGARCRRWSCPSTAAGSITIGMN
jgi:ACS family hexuronate transporter-like MFS transporter